MANGQPFVVRMVLPKDADQVATFAKAVAVGGVLPAIGAKATVRGRSEPSCCRADGAPRRNAGAIGGVWL